MNPKLILSSALLGGLVLFFWGAFAHTALPQPVTVWDKTAKVDDLLQSSAPSNGTYIDPRGVFMTVALLPDRSDKTQNMGPMLGSEFVSTLLQAAMLLWVLFHRQATTVMGYALTGAVLGALAWLSVEVSYGIWYGFSLPMLAIGLIDAAIGFGLASALIGYFIRKWRTA